MGKCTEREPRDDPGSVQPSGIVCVAGAGVGVLLKPLFILGQTKQYNVLFSRKFIPHFKLLNQ